MRSYFSRPGWRVPAGELLCDAVSGADDRIPVYQPPAGPADGPVVPAADDHSAADENTDEEEVKQEQDVVEGTYDEELLNEESQESQTAYESLKAVQEMMDPVTPHYQDVYHSSDFAAMMAQPISQKSRILKHYVNL